MMYISNRSLWLLFRDGPQRAMGKPGEQSGGHHRDQAPAGDELHQTALEGW